MIDLVQMGMTITLVSFLGVMSSVRKEVDVVGGTEATYISWAWVYGMIAGTILIVTGLLI